eukprot:CAMPEP_0171725242 /NCGR_PEP_ID=MMETSP0991-20121206/24877_1 /TAXON_ID=483369 /ORGANISM="non described non described, Strain CCMP2098" /LENGTH=322 /DNA_ID=CAMNT_0012318343 /DNA_START=280 /DNA_END=1248 /DNA_ORIENTATION=+
MFENGENPMSETRESPLLDPNIGQYAQAEEDDDSKSLASSVRTNRLPSITSGQEIEPFPRLAWARDASDEMLFHWLCTSRFNAQTLEDQRNACVAKYNPFYWLAFLATFLSLWVGREFHILVYQGGPVNLSERRHEYEVRVHWVYTTTGAMLWVFVRSLLSIAYDKAEDIGINTVALSVNWVVVACYCAANTALLRMMHLRHLAGTRMLIVCNAVFSACMLASFVVYTVDVWWHSDGVSTEEGLYKAYVLFEKGTAVLFFLMATAIYSKLWSMYKYDDRGLRRRLVETIPAVLCACIMLSLMYLGLVYDSNKFRPYVWATFT